MKSNINLIEKGYSIIPVLPNTKAAYVKDWQSFCSELPKQNIVNLWAKRADTDNAGICLGRASGLVALDLDNDINDLHKKVIEVSGTSPLIKIGKKGATLFFRYNGEESRSWRQNGIIVAELLSMGKQTILPPSIHPETKKPYEWVGDHTLHTISRDDIPYLPKDFIKRLNFMFNDKLKEIDIDELNKALTYIDPDNYETWIKIGMALKNTLEDDGFDLFLEWSAKSKKFVSEEEVKAKWKSFKNRSDITAGTIFFLAALNGFEPKRKKLDISHIVDVDKAIDTIEDWQVNGKTKGVSPMLGQLNLMYEVSPTKYTVITGEAGAGKSEFADTLALNLAEQGLKVLFCSLEKEPVEHIQSLIHKKTGKKLLDRTKEETRQAADFIKEHFTFLANEFEPSLKNLDNMANVMKRIKDIDIFIIDPYNYIELPDGISAVSYDAARLVNKAMSSMAKKYNIHVILVAHPKNVEKDKDGNKRLVTGDDIAGGSNFRNVPDFIMSVNRGKVEGNVQVVVSKVRNQDDLTTGTANFTYNKDTKKHTPF